MALIKSQLVLVDGMTAPLRSIHRAMNLALNSFESMQTASGRAVDTRSFQTAREELARMGAQLEEVENQTRRTGGAAESMKSKFMHAAAAVGAALSIKNIIGLADAMTQTEARLNLITGDLEKTAALQDQIMASANRSRASYQSTADAVAKMGIMAKDAFNNTDELVAFTELINKQFTIAGASVAGQEAAMMQLTQAMVGEDPASSVYVRNKERACAEVGLQSCSRRLPATATTEEVIVSVEELCRWADGVLVQLPLPDHIDAKKVLGAIPPEKDVDGFHPNNLGRLMIGEGGPVPCTPAGIMRLLGDVTGKHCVVVGRSNTVGKPLALMLLQADATVTVCHSKTKDLAAFTRQADVLISAVGKPCFITAEMVKPGGDRHRCRNQPHGRG